MSDVLAMGELLIDFAPDGTPNPGGAPCNFLAAAQKYGASTQFIGAVGSDEYGQLLKDTLIQAGVGIDGLKMDQNHGTTKAFVKLDEKGDRSFSFERAADIHLEEKDVDLSLVDDCKIFYFAGSLSLTDDPCKATLKKTIGYAKEKGKLIAFDPNLRIPLWNGDLERAKKELLWGIENADIVKVSDEEIQFLGNVSAKLLITTLGPHGAELKTKNAFAKVLCPKVNVVDTTGAGDICFGAAIAKYLSLGKNIEDLSSEDLKSIGEYAVLKASLSTERMGGIPSIVE